MLYLKLCLSSRIMLKRGSVGSSQLLAINLVEYLQAVICAENLLSVADEQFVNKGICF